VEVPFVTTTAPSPTDAPAAADIPPVRVAPTGFRADARAVKIVTHRELLRWSKDRGRLLTGLIQPFLFLFVLGTGLSSVVSGAIPGVSFQTFLFPGVLCTSVLFTGVFAGVSIVWDREFGFLREMLVAPIRRSSILIGKCLGGALVATGQGTIVLACAGLVDVPYDAVLLLELLGILFLVALAVCALGMLLGARIRDMQQLMPIIQLAITPMMFLSGAMYPIGDLPSWLLFLTKINPLTYAVQPMRHLTLQAVGVSQSQVEALDPPITWFGWSVPIGLQILMIGVLGFVILVAAIKRFSATD
jgi:ABC-2 type transport system permease protein